jgi:hypothetical protein
MSYYIFDLNKDIDFNQEHLIIDTKIDLDSNNCKYLLYYLDNDIPKEIFVKLPKIRLTYDWKNFKFNQLKIRITPKYNKTDNMINFFYDFEEIIKSHKFFHKKKSLEFSSIIIKDTAYYIKTFYQENKTKVSPKIKISDFKLNGEIEMVVRLNNIWKKDNKYGLSSQLYQIKYYPPPDELNVNFIDDDDDNYNRTNIYSNKSSNENQKQYHSLPPQISEPISMPFEKPKLIINSDLLKSIKLKPVDKN